jgi:hypothetical protein
MKNNRQRGDLTLTMLKEPLSRLRLIFLALLAPIFLRSQGQEEKLFLYNVGFGGITSGIGAVINKKGENWKTCFLRGLWQGSIGGLLNYSSKKSIYLVVNNKNFTYALPARLLNAAGNSIVQSAARNRPFLKDWSLDYTLFHIDFSLGPQRNFSVRLLPAALVAGSFAFGQGKLDLPTTLQTGVMVFKTAEWLDQVKRTSGINYGRAVVYLDTSNKYHIVSHEIIHEFQFREAQVLNAFFQPMAAKMKNTSFKKAFTSYLYPDVPYFGLFYMMEGNYPGDRSLRNFFEFEAERFALNDHVIIR